MLQISENKLLLFFTILSIGVLLLIGLIVFLVYLLLKKSKHKTLDNSHSNPPDQSLNLTASDSTIFCHHHEKTQSVGDCLICEHSFCKDCLKEIEGLHFCPEHISLYVNNKWASITNQKTTPKNPQDGIYIYDFKKKNWQENQIPSYILTHYKINIEGDYIESYIMLHVRECDQQTLSAQLGPLAPMKL